MFKDRGSDTGPFKEIGELFVLEGILQGSVTSQHALRQVQITFLLGAQTSRVLDRRKGGNSEAEKMAITKETVCGGESCGGSRSRREPEEIQEYSFGEQSTVILFINKKKTNIT